MAKRVVGVVLAVLVLVLLVTMDWWRPVTLSQVLSESQVGSLPSGATEIKVSGGKQGFGTDYRVEFSAEAGEVQSWLQRLGGSQTAPAAFTIRPAGGGEGPIGKTHVILGPGTHVVLTYSASL